jgi:crotonobetainyl-CoA:carnitine CoA-transferase CaiB-like acyl-CoA transferase
MEMDKKSDICADLVVIELAGVLAGPAVGMFFAELGAQVVKVENPKNGGDVTRSWRLSSENETAQSAYYSSVNYGKTVLWADLNTDADYEKVVSLIAKADIVITNFKPSSAVKLCLSANELRTLNPRLIVAEVNGYGSNDETPAFDVVLQAETGFMHLNGQADNPPTKMPVALIDLLAAHQLKTAILLALWQRERTQTGATVRIALRDAALASLANQATNWLMAGVSGERNGSLHPNIAPYGEILQTADNQHIVLAIGTDRQFKTLCNALNLNDLTDDIRFKTNTKRVENRSLLLIYLAQAAAIFSASELLNLLKTQGAPCGLVQNLPQVFAQPEAQKLLLHETLYDGQTTSRVATAVFEYL